MKRGYHVVASDPSDVDFFDIMYDALDVTKEHGLKFEYTGHENLSDDLIRYHYAQAGGPNRLTLVGDYTAATRYLIVESPTSEEEAQIVDWLGQHLPFVSLEKLQDEARARMLADPASLLRMALAAGDVADASTLEIIHDGLQSDDELVRFRAAEAAGILQWPEFIAVLESLAQSDAEPVVREMSRRALEACRNRVAQN